MHSARKAIIKLSHVERKRQFLDDWGVDPESNVVLYCPVWEEYSVVR